MKNKILYYLGIILILVGLFDASFTIFEDCKKNFIEGRNDNHNVHPQITPNLQSIYSNIDNLFQFSQGAMFLIIGLLLLIYCKVSAMKKANDQSANIALLKMNSIYNKLIKDEYK